MRILKNDTKLVAVRKCGMCNATLEIEKKDICKRWVHERGLSSGLESYKTFITCANCNSELDASTLKFEKQPIEKEKANDN